MTVPTESQQTRKLIDHQKKEFLESNTIPDLGRQDETCGFCVAQACAAEFTLLHAETHTQVPHLKSFRQQTLLKLHRIEPNLCFQMDQQRVNKFVRPNWKVLFGCLDAGMNGTRLVKFIEGFLPLGFSKLSEMLKYLTIRAHKNRLFKTLNISHRINSQQRIQLYI